MTRLATRTLREAPADEVAKNAQLLIKAGYIHKEMAGVYDYLPLGWRTLNKIIQIIREEMDAIGGQELFLTGLQNPDSWKKSGRWSEDAVDVWFKTKLHNGHEIGLSNTHEEPLTAAMINHIQSYNDLPVYVYQFQTKFRNEKRAKSGIMRTREFIMKDLYSFSADEQQHEEFYQQAIEAYKNVFRRLGIGEHTKFTFADGGSFARFSHEFQTICEAGEDTIYIHKDVDQPAINKEVFTPDNLANLGTNQDDYEAVTAAEVGNIFRLGTKFSEPIGLNYSDESGQEQPVFMGSYGIGPGRVMGVMAELLSDDKGLVWPKQVAPYDYYLIGLGSAEAMNRAQDIYDQLISAGKSVLFDDRTSVRAGEKFADADLLGIPQRLVVSDKTGEGVEHKLRTSDETKIIPSTELLETE